MMMKSLLTTSAVALVLCAAPVYAQQQKEGMPGGATGGEGRASQGQTEKGSTQKGAESTQPKNAQGETKGQVKGAEPQGKSKSSAEAQQKDPSAKGTTQTQPKDQGGKGAAQTQQKEPDSKGTAQTQPKDQSGKGTAQTQQKEPDSKGTAQTQPKDQSGKGTAQTQQKEPDSKGTAQTQPKDQGGKGTAQTQQKDPGTKGSAQAQQPKEQGGKGTATDTSKGPTPKGSDTAKGPSNSGRVHLSEQQRTNMHSTILKESNVNRATNVNFSINVGTRVPRSVHLVALPASVISLVPQYREYRYFVANDQICIVEPNSYEIVDVIAAPERTAGGENRGGMARLTLTEEEKAIIVREVAMDGGSTMGLGALAEGTEVPRDVRVHPFPTRWCGRCRRVRTISTSRPRTAWRSSTRRVPRWSS